MLDFSAAISRLGVPEPVHQAMAEAAAHLDISPDPDCAALRRQIGEAEEIDPSMVYCAADSADLIWRLVEAINPVQALLPVPSYRRYEDALKANGCKISRHVLWESKGFAIGTGLLDKLNPSFDCLVLCQPNNPTGLMIPQQLLLALIDKCARCGIYLLLDETFLDFIENPMLSTEKPLLARYPNMILIKTPSLTHGMASIPLAYCMTSNVQLLSRMQTRGRPGTVSAIAQAAGIAALKDPEYAERARRTYARNRQHMIALLDNIGVTVFHGEANFLLFHTWQPNLAELLKAEGFLVQDCSDYPGLMPGYCRIGLRTLTENSALAKAIHSILKRSAPESAAPPVAIPAASPGETIL